MDHGVSVPAALAVVVCLAVSPAALTSQEPDSLPGVPGAAVTDSSPKLYMGLYGEYARAVGEFGHYVRHGGGMSAFAALPVRRGSPLTLRADGGVIIYGSEKFQTWVGGGRVALDVTTTNTILFLNAGPQLIVPAGRLRPYGNVAVGVALFTTGSTLSGRWWNDEPLDNQTHQTDVTVQWLAGGGVAFPLSDNGFGFDVGVRYHGNGRVEYLTRGDISEGSDGRLQFTPTRSQANLVSIRVGVTVSPMRR